MRAAQQQFGMPSGGFPFESRLRSRVKAWAVGSIISSRGSTPTAVPMAGSRLHPAREASSTMRSRSISPTQRLQFAFVVCWCGGQKAEIVDRVYRSAMTNRRLGSVPLYTERPTSAPVVMQASKSPTTHHLIQIDFSGPGLGARGQTRPLPSRDDGADVSNH